MKWSRRELFRFLTAMGVWSSTTLLRDERETQVMLGSSPRSPFQTQPARAPQPPSGQTYAYHGYKIFILDFQFSDVDPETMRRANAEKLAEAMAEMGVDSLLVYAITNSGFALYNSKYTPKFKNLRDNFLDEYLEACRKRKIKTVLYYSLGWQRILDADHLDWAVLDRNDKPVYYDPTVNGFMGKVNYLCLNSPFRQHALQQIKEIADRFTFDSMFIDILFWSWDRSFVCYNPHCLKAWKQRTGADLPRPLPNELYPAYVDFATDTHRSAYQEIKDQLKKSGRNVPTTHNFGFDYEHDDYLIFESNPQGLDFYETAASSKLYRARAQGRELQMLPHLNNNYLDYVNAPLPKLEWQTAMILGHNAAVMWGQQANVDGTLDAETVRLGKKVFQVADRFIPKIRGTLPYAEMAILSSERDMVLSNGANYADYYGAHKLLSDLHWPFDVVEIEKVKSAAELSRYRLLIVPNVEYLSARQRANVLEFLENGGRLFFCGHCALFDGNGKPHAEPHFGLVQIEETHSPRGYFKPVFPIDDARLKAANIATVVSNSQLKTMARLIRVSQTRRAGSPLTDVAYPLDETNLPVVVSGRKGKGTFIYAGFRLFSEYIEQNLPLIGQVFSEFVEADYQIQVWVEAPTVVDVIYNQLGSELRLAIINGITGRPSSSRPSVGGDQRVSGFVNIVEVIPIHNIRIRLKGSRVLRVTNLEGQDLRFDMNHGDTEINLPPLHQYELITIALK